MCVYFLLPLFFLFRVLVCALGKKDIYHGQFHSITNVHAGSHMSKLVATLPNHGYFMLKCLTFNY